MVEIVQDLAGPCERCGHSINHHIHVPPFGIAVTIAGDSEKTPTHQWKRAETPLNITPDANTQRDIIAGDLVQCLKMWDCTRAEADDVLRRARNLCKKAETWNNPLQGTGLKPMPGAFDKK